ncbi:MAG: hypothetical protein ACTTJH_02575 [Bacteroidales bacterium]
MRIILVLLLCFMSYEANIKLISKINVFAGIAVILCILYFLQTGLFDDASHTAHNALGEERERHSFGVGYNRLSLLVFSISLNLYILLYGKIKKLLMIIIFSIIPYIVFLLTGSQTSFVGGLSLVLFHVLFHTKATRSLIERKALLYCIPIFLLGVTIFTAYISPYFPQLDLIFTGRPMFTLKFLNTITPMALFIGDAESMASSDYMALDSAHMHLVFEAGIAIYIFFYTIYVKTIKFHFILKKQYEGYNSYTLPVLLSMMVVGLGEDVLFSIALIGFAIFWIILFKNAKLYDNYISNYNVKH